MTIKELYSLYTQHYLVDTDTRSIRLNTVFFALKGENFNGNEFAEDALEQGALYAIVDEIKFKTKDNIILVDDALSTLQELASYHRSELNLPILALTGSNGKTTTKELIHAVLSQKFKTSATKGNLNNHIGVPLTLLSMDSNTEFGIVEMGANHLKEIEFLCKIAKPNFGYITNFGKAHLEGFGGIEGVIKGKSELYDFIRNTNGKVFINPDDSVQLENSKGIHAIPFHSTLTYINANPYVNLTYENFEFNSKLIGSYNYTNIAAAITIGNYFKVDSFQIKSAIESYTPTNNRSQIIKIGTTKFILDAYNANPSSMSVALSNFDKLEDKNKNVVLGDMFELGDTASFEHQEIVNQLESLSVNSSFIIGELFSQTSTKKALKFERFSDFINSLDTSNFNNSTILIKGSRGMALERILDLF